MTAATANDPILSRDPSSLPPELPLGSDIPENLDPLAAGILMDHQKEWLEDKSDLKLCEKGRRTGITFAEALDDTLKAPSALVVVSNDTLAAKIGKHAAIDTAGFGQVQQMLETGTAIDRRADNKGINFWMDQGGYLRRVVVRQSAEGYLYIGTLFVSSANLLKSHLAKYGEWGGE
ncbi:Mu-like prophage FluMu protein gp28 [Roseibium alexandrii]|uniref:Mu-like prophage FluMu protein gp28 n=1 Tax=Roseibium alexandrii TaxID=388408 RepID=A0A0M7ASE9_9HYPH|nr:Mu-like prophage FluMu protein gp28 [Roseibium alexandrii]